MAQPSNRRVADNSMLRRSSTATTTLISSPAERSNRLNSTGADGRKSRLSLYGPLPQGVASTRRVLPQPSKMAGARIYENHIPSFMSVYGMDSGVMDRQGVGAASKKASGTTTSHEQQREYQPPRELLNDKLHAQIHSHQHRESTSTQTSDSTDSSPTTTISTVDSSSLSDPSPSSSPESPVTLVPLSSFGGSTFGLDKFQSLNMDDSNTIRVPLNHERPMTSPSPRKAKNPKSLALNLTPSTEAFQLSAPSSPSPSFIKPPMNTLKGRRKASLLTLNTGAANGNSLALDVPGSPGMSSMLQRRALKHSISSPQMLSTPGFGPLGGMTLGERAPSRMKESTLGTFTIDEDADHEAPGVVQMATRVPGFAVGGDSFDRPEGDAPKSPSYPDGPILMHEPNVHLYLEPKIEEAMQYDVIINVAREVKNPFKSISEERPARDIPKTHSTTTASSFDDSNDLAPDTAATMVSFQTAFEYQPSGSASNSTESSPSTPRPTVEKKIPEYIHVPWDHNSDVKDELWDLCQTIEARTKEGKRVLVHCQQGASRSATLIIAYGMYINQDLTANEAYELARSKSKWVNPNMSLFFSLNDFKKVIDMNKTEKREVRKHRPSLSAEATVETPPTPSRARGNSTPSTTARDDSLRKGDEFAKSYAVGKSTIHPGFDFGFGNAETTIELPNKDEGDWESGLMSPRLTEMTDNPLHHAFPDSKAKEPPTHHVFSPTTSTFPHHVFPTPGTSLRTSVLIAGEDPRSPPTRGEAPITRSIDDVL